MFHAAVLADICYLFYAILQSIIVKEFLPHRLRTMEMISLAHTLLISVCFLLFVVKYTMMLNKYGRRLKTCLTPISVPL